MYNCIQYNIPVYKKKKKIYIYYIHYTYGVILISKMSNSNIDLAFIDFYPKTNANQLFNNAADTSHR